MIQLDLLITRSLTLPRAVTSRMRASLRANPTRAIRYDQLVDHLMDNMVRAYRLGFREFGVLRRDTERAMRAEFRRKAREVLIQYQVFANQELRRVYREHIRGGATQRQATDQVLRKFRLLGVTPPATNRMKTLYTTALTGAFNAGQFDSTRNNRAIWGYRFRCREVGGGQHPTTRDSHWALNRITLPRDHELWERGLFPPISYNCYCRIQVLKRAVPIVQPSQDISLPVDEGFSGTGFELR